MTKHPLIGTWRLQSCRHILEDGSEFYPFGKNATGLLVYTEDGTMSGCLASGDRPHFHSRELFGGTEAEKAAAAGTYLAYMGTYEISEGEVIHSVEMSLFPNWVGTKQRRIMKLEGDKLTLSTHPFTAGGKLQTAELVWRRNKS